VGQTEVLLCNEYSACGSLTAPVLAANSSCGIIFPFCRPRREADHSPPSSAEVKE
jgi:hypothetical protein